MATTEETVDKIHDLVLSDRRTKVWRSTRTRLWAWAAFPCPKQLVHPMGAARRLPAPEIMDNCEITSKRYLAAFYRNLQEFMGRLVLVHKTWIHWYPPYTKQQSKKGFYRWTCTKEGEMWWPLFPGNAGRVIHVAYLEKGKTVTVAYYIDL